MPSLSKSLRWTLLLSTTAVLAACEVGPNYHRAPVETPPAFKEAEGWTPAQPADGVDRGEWWTVFNDPLLNQLESQVRVSNQTLAADLAAYNEAHAIVAEDQATLFPTVNLNSSAIQSKRGGTNQVTGTGAVVRGGAAVNEFEVEPSASWAPDVWGKIRREVEVAKANAQASYADLANARLSAQSTLAADYLELRMLDAEAVVLTKTGEAYKKSLAITRNQYEAGTVSKSNVLQAETTLDNAQAGLTDLGVQRTASEHAIAVLIGKPPAELTIPADPNWAPQPPATPTELPSTLLQRRPDVAAAERAAASASAQIGVQVAGFFPNITLTGDYGVASQTVSNLFNSSNVLYSIGASAAETVFDAGATRARVRQAKATRDQAVAEYRQTVLTAFQQVEDDLAASRVLQNEEPQRAAASEAADEEETVAFNEYRAGTVDYTTVVTAQAAALSARQTLLTLQVQRMTTEVSLITALGGGWSTKQLPKS
ncbi:MAG TPA: efflux transporter outer membrane subunit [Caulobacteraceae bacterium]|jgi:NodT family efflux transporter outer membrane factor (OMF) lipoprotein|nr:efflux transporter outer membrane subunit [Caulobacteraceae bacterium]